MDNKLMQLLKKMNDFQEQNNITEECLTNAQFVYKFIKNNQLGECNVRAVVVAININDISEAKDKKIVCCCHFVVEFENKIIDPSYEYNKYPNAIYYTNYNKFIEAEFNVEDKIYFGEYTKMKYINNFLKFYKLEIEVNLTNKIKRLNEEYYSRLVSLIYNL